MFHNMSRLSNVTPAIFQEDNDNVFIWVEIYVKHITYCVDLIASIIFYQVTRILVKWIVTVVLCLSIVYQDIQ